MGSVSLFRAVSLAGPGGDVLTTIPVPLDIDLLQPVSYEDGWNELVLPEGHRKMVQAMVETFAAASSLNTGLHTEEQPQPNLDKVGFDPVKQKGELPMRFYTSVACGRTRVLSSPGDSRSRLCDSPSRSTRCWQNFHRR